ncbi:MAG: hypothetical protein OSJ45_12030 [Lachnospiraceae bacterium]|nr:hypothetical protein [Lachnospiraceae bacterium]
MGEDVTDGYSANGFGGQRIIVLPDQKIVCIIQAKPTASGKSYDDLIPVIRAAASPPL